MPKVILGTENRKKDMFSKWLAGSMKVNKISQSAMGTELGISQVGFGKKMRTAAFTYEEMILMFKKLGASDEEILMLMKI